MWVKRDGYWEETSPQKSLGWRLARVGRIGTSETYYMTRDNEKIKKTIEETGKVIAGKPRPPAPPENALFMNHGNLYEPKARKWYEKTYNVKVVERGQCVPFFDLERIGASVDGDVFLPDGTPTEGIIEIKCPQEMYEWLKDYIERKGRGWKPSPGYHGHIFHSHYYQMLQAMKVLGKKWCDYIVYCVSSRQIFIERVHFNSEDWERHYSILKENYPKYILPHLPPGYPVIPPLPISEYPPPPEGLKEEFNLS